MDDVLRVVAAPDAPGVAGDASTVLDVGTRRRPRRGWRWAGLAGLALLLVGLGGLQVQAARVRAQTEQAEAVQRNAELEEEAARIRLESVGDRVRVARAGEAEARSELDRSRADMTAKGFEESSLASLQASTAKEVKGLRAGVAKVANDIAEKKRLQPAAEACLFDMLRALGRVDTGARSGQTSDACKTVAASPGPA